MKNFLSKVLDENPGLPCFCFGHSTGAAIVLKAALDVKVRANIAGIILTSPAIGIQPTHPIITVLAPVVSFLMPRFQLSAANQTDARNVNQTFGLKVGLKPVLGKWIGA
uniref:Uncharacterized protein isoform X2 n=1 Tax=Nicotiana tabacum TaxID=4097 RepID=A0A1S3XGK0_TOBAC|nr:PREDICTED: uncharacterized protein LOC107764950 isoform X2 [Nicotiana tabacum]